MRRFLFAIPLLCTILVASISPTEVGGQDDEPAPGPQAAAALLEGDEIGSGWVASNVVGPTSISEYRFEMSPDVFREGAARVYGGPDGSRIVIISLLLSESRVAIRQSWEDATEFMDEVSGRISYDYDRREALQTLDPPPGCVEAKREEGLEYFYLVPMGATMCATDPDGILIAIVSGSVNGASGVDASDALIGMLVGNTQSE